MSVETLPVSVDPHSPQGPSDPPDVPSFDEWLYPESESSPPPSVHTIHTSSRKVTDRLYRTNGPPIDQTPLLFKELEDHTYRGHFVARSPDEYRAGLELCQALDGRLSHRLSDRFQNCGTHAWFQRNKHTGEVRVRSPRCRMKMCQRCIGVDRNIKAAAVEPWAHRQRYLKMVTLTQQHHGESPKQMLKKLYSNFRKLKSRVFWKSRVTGMVWFLHAKFSWKSGTWHLHLHALVAGNFIPHGELRDLWHKITGDSTIVEIHAIKDVDQAVGDVARYAASPADQTQLDLEQRLDLFNALKNRRCCGSSGSAKGILLRPAAQDDGGDWTRIGNFEFVSRNKLCDPTCAAIWKAAWTGDPYDGPDAQPESDLYEDEMDVLMDPRGPPETYRQFMMRLQQLRNSIRRGFDIAAEPAPF